jgi:hypothetical protein
MRSSASRLGSRRALRRALLLAALLLASAGCGGSRKSSNTIPDSQLDPASAPAEPVAPAPAEPVAPAEPPPSPPPAGPLQITIEASKATVKLVNAGKGARSKLRLTARAAAKQTVDLLMDAVIEQSPTGQPGEVVTMPTVVLTSTAEVTAVDPEGAATYHAVVDSVDARDRPNQTLPAATVKTRLGSLTGMTIDGAVSASGNTGAATYAIEKPEADTAGAIESLKLMLPTWVLLPAEAVGTGATWEVSVPVEWNGIATTQVTTFKLVKRTAAATTISGETKVTGANQMLQDVEVSEISGSGRVDATFESGKLYPRLKRTISTKVRLKQGTEDVTINMQVGSAFEPK